MEGEVSVGGKGADMERAVSARVNGRMCIGCGRGGMRS